MPVQTPCPEEVLCVLENRFVFKKIPGYILSGFKFGAQVVELFCDFRTPEIMGS